MLDAVEHLLTVFGQVRRPERVEGCPHCVGPEESRLLLDRPVRFIEPDVLAPYAFGAITMWGDVAEFRYFVPRLLECAAADAFGFPDPQIVFTKLALAGWLEWRGDERAAVETLLAAWWADTLGRYPTTPEIGTVLCCLGGTGIDMTPFLERWGRLTSVEAIRHLHDFVMSGVVWSRGPRLADAFWDRRGTAHRAKSPEYSYSRR